MKTQQQTKKSAAKKAREAEFKFAGKVGEYAKSHHAPAPDMQMFRDALGYGRLSDTMLASDLRLRRKAGKFLAERLETLKQERPELEFYLWTLAIPGVIHLIASQSSKLTTYDR